MSYTNSTPNYELPQWIGTDKPTFLGDFNSAFSAIDTAMKNNADAASAATSTANAAQATAASANTNANTALSTANNAKDTADAATSAAASASSTANTAKTTADAAATAALGNNISNLAPAYDPTLTYQVGDLVTYVDAQNTGKLYKCIVAVNSPMAFNVNYWDDVTTSEVFGAKEIPFFTYTSGSGDTYKDIADRISDNVTYAAGNKNFYKNIKMYVIQPAPDTHIDMYPCFRCGDNGASLTRIFSASDLFGTNTWNLPKDKTSADVRYRVSQAHTNGTIESTDLSSDAITTGTTFVLTHRD